MKLVAESLGLHPGGPLNPDFKVDWLANHVTEVSVFSYLDLQHT